MFQHNILHLQTAMSALLSDTAFRAISRPLYRLLNFGPLAASFIEVMHGARDASTNCPYLGERSHRGFIWPAIASPLPCSPSGGQPVTICRMLEITAIKADMIFHTIRSAMTEYRRDHHSRTPSYTGPALVKSEFMDVISYRI